MKYQVFAVSGWRSRQVSPRFDDREFAEKYAAYLADNAPSNYWKHVVREV